LKPVIQDLWIFSKTGLAVFEHVPDDEINPDLFGAMISALNMYSETLSEGSISSFDIKDKRFVLILVNNFLFVCRVSQKVQISLVKIELYSIAEKFFNRFSFENTKNWKGGDTNKFLKFKEDLDF